MFDAPCPIKMCVELDRWVGASYDGMPAGNTESLQRSWATENARIYDVHVDTIANQGFTQAPCITGAICSLAGPLGPAVLFPEDLLKGARAEAGSDISNYEIAVPFAFDALLSELAIVVAAQLLAKGTSEARSMHWSGLRSCLKANAEIAQQSRLNPGEDMQGRPRQYLRWQRPEPFPRSSLHDRGSWTPLELGVLRVLRRMMAAFMIGHEFGHILTNTHKRTGEWPTVFTGTVEAALDRWAVTGIRRRKWADEVEADIIGTELTLHYAARHPLLTQVLQRALGLRSRPGPHDTAYAATAWLGARGLLSALILVVGEEDRLSHPSARRRIDAISSMPLVAEYNAEWSVLNQIGTA